MILAKSYVHPCNPVFEELPLLLQSRILYHIALLVFKTHTELAPNYLNNILYYYLLQTVVTNYAVT